ncbi:hypothetical protein BgiBS90_023417, partial [Biomphalaria glabrata]
ASKKRKWPEDLKTKILAQYEAGMSEVELVSIHGVPRSTIRTWRKNQERIAPDKSKE